MMYENTQKYWNKKQHEIKANKESKKVLIEVAAMHPLKDGDKPSEEFESRLVKGMELYYKEIEAGNHPIIYVPGSTHYIMKDGEKQVDLIPLAEAGKRYLIEHGIPEEDIRANDANIKYQGERGTYNSGDECLVASKIFKDEDCSRLISVVSPVQAFRKALFYNEFGVNPEIYTVPLDKTAHNYVGETFWSLYVTAFLDHDWQGEKSFLATLTRKERFDGYEFSEEEKNTLENSRIVLPQEILDIKQKMIEQYKEAQANTNSNITIPFSRTLIELSDDISTFKQSVMEAIKISKAEAQNGRGVTICSKSEEEKENLASLMKLTNVENVSFVVTDDAVKEYLSTNAGSNVTKYGRLYKICKADQAMGYGIDAIQKGVVPLITTIPTDHDDFITPTFELYDKIIGKDLINKLYKDSEIAKQETDADKTISEAPSAHEEPDDEER